MKRKIIAFLLAFLMLAGCAVQPEPEFKLIIDSPAQTSAPEPEQTPEPAPEAEPEATYEVTEAPETEVSTGETHFARPNASVSFMAVGDVILHNTVLDYGRQNDGSYNYDDLFCWVNEYISSFDLAAVNQETPLVTDPSRYSAYPEFGSPTAIADAEVKAGFDIVSMATNHVCDKGDSGILQSVEYFKTNYPDIALLGIHDSQEDADTITVIEQEGIKIALLNYAYGFNGYGPSNRWMCDTFSDESKIADDLARAEELADITIVFAHDGTEYQHQPDDGQVYWYRFLADHGADAVIGTHPHVLQPMELYETSDGRSVPIYWSLGNFMSHQLDTARWLGGIAEFDIVMDNEVCRIENAHITPTFTYIWYEGSVAHFRSCLLEDMTQELVDNSYYKKYYGTLDALWELYDSIVG